MAKNEIETQTVAVNRPVTIHIEPRSIWLAAAVAMGLLLRWIIFIRGLQVLIFFFIAIILAEGMRPLITWMGNYIPRPIAVILLYIVLLVILGAAIYRLARPLAVEATQAVNHLPQYLAKLQQLSNQLERTLGPNVQFSHLAQKARSEILHAAKGLTSMLIHLPLTLLGLFLRVLEVLFIAFFWLTAVHHLQGFVAGLLPPDARPEARRS